ncbi:MAG: 50S ribosomal protein L10 [Candidatus Pacebacteria bacterium]|nr:50S ribosomal protein L10 [Candidatus Paceibacterota bacterium]
MPSAKNVSQLQTLEEKAKRAKSTILTNYAGLTLAQQTKLRAELRSAGGELVVAKNTLLSRVLNKPELTSQLHGQTGVVFSYDDEVGGIKKLVEFVKNAEKPEIKVGFMGKTMLTLAEIKELAKLPGKMELMSMLISRLQGPAYGLVNTLSATARNLVYAVKAIEKKKAQ